MTKISKAKGRTVAKHANNSAVKVDKVSKASAKPAKGASKAKAVKATKAKAKAKGESTWQASPSVVAAREAASAAMGKVTDGAKVLKVNLDTMRTGSEVYKRFAKVKAGTSVAKLLEAGIVSRSDLACALSRGRITVSKAKG